VTVTAARDPVAPTERASARWRTARVLRQRYLSTERLLTLTTVAALLSAWVLLSQFHLVNPLFLPAPSAVWDAFVTTAVSGYQGSRLDQRRVWSVSSPAGCSLASSVSRSVS